MTSVARDSKPAKPEQPAKPEETVTVDRYTTGARINHWITAISLILLAVSGLSLFHPSLFFLTALFGGGEMTRIIHPWIGVVLFFSFLGMFLRFWRLNLWKAEDGTWLRRGRDVLAGREENLPELGKYNAGQKFVFWSMTALILILISSGLVIWDQYFSAYTSVEQKRVAILIHSAVAIIAILVWITHVYAAIWVRGTVHGMVQGNVTGGWAWRHHRKWLREESAKHEVHIVPKRR
jgi:formate dehydrogenase subunit gamma